MTHFGTSVKSAEYLLDSVVLYPMTTYIGSEMNCSVMLCLRKRVVCFYIPEPWWRYIKHTAGIVKHRMGWFFISDSFYHMVIPKISIFHYKSVYYGKIPLENRSEAPWLSLCHMFLFMDVSGKEARNWCKSVI